MRTRLAVRVLACAVLLGACSSPHPAAVARPDAAVNSLWRHFGDTAGPGQWSGGDGTSSVRLPGGRVAWFFSDTYLGAVNPDGSRNANRFVHNSLVVQDGDRLATVAADSPVQPPPGTPGWYWAGAGLVENGELVEFYHRINGFGQGEWNFTEQGVAIATFSLPGLRLQGVRELPAAPPLPARTPIMWGAAVFEQGAWTYVYGYRGHLDRLDHPKWLYLARAPRGHVTDAAWSYATGAGWSSDLAQAAELPTRVDSGFGVARVRKGYALVTRRPSADLGDGAVLAYLARSPAGPFGDRDSALIYRAPETSSGWFVYQARVHPQLAGHDRLVMSYNVNTSLVDSRCTPQNLRQAGVYRPRFVTVPYSVFRRGYSAPPASPARTAPGWFRSCPKPSLTTP